MTAGATECGARLWANGLGTKFYWSVLAARPV